MISTVINEIPFPLFPWFRKLIFRGNETQKSIKVKRDKQCVILELSIWLLSKENQPFFSYKSKELNFTNVLLIMTIETLSSCRSICIHSRKLHRESYGLLHQSL